MYLEINFEESFERDQRFVECWAKLNYILTATILVSDILPFYKIFLNFQGISKELQILSVHTKIYNDKAFYIKLYSFLNLTCSKILKKLKPKYENLIMIF